MDANKVVTIQDAESAFSRLSNNENFQSDFLIIEKFISDCYERCTYESENQNFNVAYQFISAGLNFCDSTMISLKKLIELNENDDLKSLFEQKYFLIEIFKLKFDFINNFTTGLFHFSNRNPGLANKYFSESEKNSKELYNKTKEEIYSIQSKFSGSYKHMSEGLEKTITGDLIEARKNYQLAMIGFEDIYKKLEHESNEAADLFKLKTEYVRIDCSIMLNIANAQYYFRSKNYKLSIENYQKLITSNKQTISKLTGLDPDSEEEYEIDDKTESFINFYKGNTYYYSGHLNISAGLEKQESKKWEDALELFEKVRTEWTRATEYFLKSEIPQAIVLQESISQNEYLIDQYISSCIKDKEQQEKINELEEKVKTQQQELFNMLKPAGITVNNIQDINNTVEQNVQVVQKIENKTRESIKELLELIRTVPINEPEKKEIETEGKKLIESDEKGIKFLDKAKSYTEKVSGILKNVTDIAGPVMTAVNMLGMLLK